MKRVEEGEVAENASTAATQPAATAPKATVPSAATAPKGSAQPPADPEPPPEPIVEEFVEGEDGTAEATLAYWASRPGQERAEFLKQRQVEFDGLLDSWLKKANDFSVRVVDSRRNNQYWRVGIAVVAFIVAVVNVFISQGNGDVKSLAIAAAVLGTFLALVTSLAGIADHAGNAERYHAAHVILANAYRDLDTEWRIKVADIAKDERACSNAQKLFRRASVVDSQLREQLRELMPQARLKAS